jgi:hypothetical protein
LSEGIKTIQICAIKKEPIAGHWWLMPETLAIWKAEIRRITIKASLGKIVHEIPSSKVIRAKWARVVA